MALVPLEGEPEAREPGILALSHRQVQQAGVRIGTVQERDLVREIDATGRLDMNHHLHRTITSWIPGRSRIQKLRVHYTGEIIREGQILVELYSPTLVASVEEYRIALQAHESIRESGAPEAALSSKRLVESSRDRLVRFGLSTEQIESLASHTPSHGSVPTIPIRAPISGTLLQPASVKEGGYLQEGDVLFQLADLSSLWLFVDVYEYELPFVSVGQIVSVSTRALPGQTFDAEIALIEPLVQERTRTVRVRCVIENAEGKLAPGMYTRVRIRSVLPGLLSVPESAVLQSGRRDVVIVSEGDGRFRPRISRIGRRYLYEVREDDRGKDESLADGERYHEVLSGLAEGDRIVVAGNFLLNAEAQFQGILKKMLDPAEAADQAPVISDEVRSRLDAIIKRYVAIGAALVADRGSGLSETARALKGLAGEAKGLLSESSPEGIRGILDRLHSTADALAGVEPDDLGEARKQFASLSREMISYVRDFAPARVEDGDLHLFRCPMANDAEHGYGYDLWIQEEPDLANPYMGQLMPG